MRQVGALDEESSESSMAPITYNCMDVAIEEGATFIFGSYLYIADGAGGFARYLAYSVSSSSLPPASSFEASGDLADQLRNLGITDPIST
jgi:hypothetical protein